ncbi:hypothetical protein [Kutzneria chonburiensis]|uniref:Uncharacterized protein n=1 Tax=Kutzneria chonburiensis TaxID=1483604 RepID=A0ABV6MP13_9PSEU|nr:hypothetical protein [Kutzneria chonburiensis]
MDAEFAEVALVSSCRGGVLVAFPGLLLRWFGIGFAVTMLAVGLLGVWEAL